MPNLGLFCDREGEMPDDNPNPGTGEGQQPPTNPPATGQGEGGEDVEGLKRALKAERDARKAHEKDLNELRAWKQQQEEAGRSEAEKSAARLSQLEADNNRLKGLERQISLEREVGRLNRNGDNRLGIVDEDAAIRLLDPEEIEYDAAGKPTNLLPLLKELIKERPYLAAPKRPGSADGGAGNGQQSGGMSLDDRIRTMAGRR